MRIDSKERIGVVGFNKYGSKMVVDEYNNHSDIWVKFVETGNRVHTNWKNFNNRMVRNVFDKSIYGVGYIGEGKYNVSIECIYTPQYISWSRMMERCYSQKFIKRNPTYNGCIVCEEWHDFQNFAKWYDQNYYQIENEKMNLDKDIIKKGNKLYSPDTCIFVPHSINSLFIKRNARRGNLPLGVTLQDKKYRATCSTGKGKQLNLGYFNTIDNAFIVYKEFKEKLIKEIADNYKGKVPNKLYDAMIKYEVEIND